MGGEDGGRAGSVATVYNFEVEKTHTYYVGTEGVLVHNSCQVEALSKLYPNVGKPIWDDFKAAINSVSETSVPTKLRVPFYTELAKLDEAALKSFIQDFKAGDVDFRKGLLREPSLVDVWKFGRTSDLKSLNVFKKSIDKLSSTGFIKRINGNVLEFIHPVTNQPRVQITGGILSYKYGHFGGDIICSPNKTITVLGRWNDDLNPLFGTHYFLENPGIVGLMKGSYSRGGNNLNGLNFLDIETKFYDDLIRTYGDIVGKQKFWEKYNLQFLEDAFKNGHDIRVVSDPNNLATVMSTYERELDTIRGIDKYGNPLSDARKAELGITEPLMKKYGYKYNSTTFSFEKIK